MFARSSGRRSTEARALVAEIRRLNAIATTANDPVQALEPARLTTTPRLMLTVLVERLGRRRRAGGKTANAGNDELDVDAGDQDQSHIRAARRTSACVYGSRPTSTDERSAPTRGEVRPDRAGIVRPRRGGRAVARPRSATAGTSGMKVHVGAQVYGLPLVHSVAASTAAENELGRLGELLHGAERELYGDRGYWSKEDRRPCTQTGIAYRVQQRSRATQPLTERERRRSQRLARIRARAEHPFHVIKRLWGFAKVAGSANFGMQPTAFGRG